jgi:hypothetical protein
LDEYLAGKLRKQNFQNLHYFDPRFTITETVEAVPSVENSSHLGAGVMCKTFRT